MNAAWLSIGGIRGTRLHGGNRHHHLRWFDGLRDYGLKESQHVEDHPEGNQGLPARDH